MSNNQLELEKRYFGLRSTCFGYLDISPKLFKKYLDNELEEEKKSYFELGTKLHMYLLEPDKFKENYIYLSIDKPKSKNQNDFCERVAELVKISNTEVPIIVSNAYKEIYATDKKSEDKIKKESKELFDNLKEYIEYLINRTKYKDTLNYQDISFLKEAKEEVKNHKIANKLILENSIIDNKDIYAVSEQRIYWEYPLFTYENKPLVLRSTLDRFIINHKTKEIILIDIKTSGNLPNFNESFEKYKYYRQLASYWLAAYYFLKTEEQFKDVLEKWDDYSRKTYIVAIQTPNYLKNYPIECKVIPISEVTLGQGVKELNSNIDDVLWYLTNNKWDHSRHYYDSDGLEKVL